MNISAHALFSRGQWEIPLNYYDCDVKFAMFLETLSGREPDLQIYLGAVHMSRASPANRADLSHENLYFSTT